MVGGSLRCRSERLCKCSLECLLLDISDSLVDAISEFLDILGVDVAIIGLGDNALCVMLVLHLHSCKAAEINIGAEVATCSNTLLDADVQLEGLVSLVLAVGEACFLLSGLSIAKFSLDAVLLALTEQERWK